MKSKIKIMKQRPEISDKEIHSYMNFEELLSKQKALQTGQHAFLKGLAKWALISTAVVSIPLVYFYQRSSDNIANEKQEIAESVTQELPTVGEDPVVEISEQLPAEQKTSKESVADNVASSKTPSEGNLVTAKKLPTESAYVQAEPLDGYDALYKYFNDNLQYPEAAIPDSIQGVQVVSFVINKEGRPIKIEFVETLGEPFEAESQRLIDNMPAWKPATMNGQPVLSKLSIPLTFRIKKVESKEE